MDPSEGHAVTPRLEIVRPAGGRTETLIVAGVVAGILAVDAAAVSARRIDTSEPRLLEWQISAFYDLDSADQAIYNALTAAAEELWWAHGELLTFGTEEERANPWPTVEQLDADYLMPPFHRDASWSAQGAVEWQRIASFSFEGQAVYFGSGGQLEGQSAYLLSLSHTHKGASYADGATVWVHKDPNVAPPDTVKRDSLILHGWKEVVPYSGAMEVKRLKGE